jgi:hypothetical protein
MMDEAFDKNAAASGGPQTARNMVNAALTMRGL